MGTRAFSAPETIPDDYEETFQYTNAVDMWSLGCVIYNILAHSLPYNNSRAKSLPFPTQPLEDRVDCQGINLLECLLRVDPTTRWTAQEAVKHPWLEASGEASFAAAEDAAGIAKPLAQPERPNESQDKPIRLDEEVDMPTFIPSREKTCPKPKDQKETPIIQLISKSPEFRGKNDQIVSRSDNDGRGGNTSNTLKEPSVKVHHNSLAMQRHQMTEEQAEEKMDLVTTLQNIQRRKGDPEQNKIATALELIRKGVDLELRSNGETALHLAVRICCFKNAGHATQIFHELLERGADVNAFNGVGETALHIAVTRGMKIKIEIVRQLLRYKADVNAKRLKVLRTPLHYAAEYSSGECINVLLAAGAQVNELDEQGQTALHVASICWRYGDIIARKLIRAGIDINVIDKSGKTALDIAIRRKNSAVIEVIKAKQDALDMARDGKNVQHVRGNRGSPRTTSSIPQGRSWRSLFALGKH